MTELLEEDALRVAQLEAGVRCKWSWAWLKLEAKVDLKSKSHVFPLSHFFKKFDKAGHARCILCSKEINYSCKGSHALLAHCTTEKHVAKVSTIMTTHSIVETTGVNRVNPPTQQSTVQQMRGTVKLPVPLFERVANAEAMVLGTMAELSLPLSAVSAIVELAQTLALDKPALEGMKLSRTAASYKMVLGLGHTLSERTFEHLRHNPFSINLDESVSSAYKKVLSVLVSYFNQGMKRVVVEHLGSIEVTKVTAQHLESSLVNFFTDHNIPFANMVSMMMDSCRVMRGSKSGLETRIREKHCQNLLDVDGDSCHHIHNATRQFAAPFRYYLEQLFKDLHTDHQWASDQVKYLLEICEFLAIPGTNPQRFVAHRWLSAYDVGINTRRMLPAYKVLYFGFLSQADQTLYQEVLEEIFEDHHVGERAKARIQLMHQDLKKKGMTQVGKERKERVVKKLWFESLSTDLQLSIYLAVLPILKEYVMVFQGSQTLVHKLHDKQLEVLTSFMACCIKSEHLHTSPKTLVEMEIKDKMLPLTELYVGPVAEKLKAENPRHPIVLQFLKTVKTAYMSTAAYMQKKLPLNSKTLQALSALDPLVRGHSETGKLLKRLSGPGMMGHLVPPQCDLPLEVLKFNVDSTLPPYEDGDNLVTWWGSVIDTGRYPGLNHVVRGALSIFHGPMVESSFSSMGDIINNKSTTMSMETYNAIQTTRYALRSKCQTAIQMFKREDVKLSKVDKVLCKNIHTAGTRDKRRRKKALLKKKEKQEEFLCLPTVSAAQSRRTSVEEERQAKIQHLAALKRKRALEVLVQKREKHKC